MTELWPGGPKFSNAPGVFPLGTDAVLLADFARRPGRRRLLDLGCGGGAVSILLAFALPTLEVTGLDIDPAAIALAAENARANGLSSRCRFLTGDIRACRSLLSPASFDLVVANPPYFPVAANSSPARSEHLCTLPQLCAAAAFSLRPGGDFTLVYRPERLSALLCAMTAAGMEPKRLRFAVSAPTAPPSLVLVEGRKGARCGLQCLPPLLLKAPDGGPSAELHRIYHSKGGSLCPEPCTS